MPIDEYEKWQRLSKARLFGMLEEVWERNADVPAEDLERDVEEALARLRRESRAPKAS